MPNLPPWSGKSHCIIHGFRSETLSEKEARVGSSGLHFWKKISWCWSLPALLDRCCKFFRCMFPFVFICWMFRCKVQKEKTHNLSSQLLALKQNRHVPMKSRHLFIWRDLGPDPSFFRHIWHIFLPCCEIHCFWIYKLILTAYGFTMIH